MDKKAVQGGVSEKFSAALETLVGQVKRDRSVLAAILCGSLSHDTVWEKSDIDLVLVTIDDQKPAKEAISLYADGINVHALLLPRTEFRQLVEGSIRNSFAHSLLAKGRLLYTHDETIAGLCAQLRDDRGPRITVDLLAAACGALPAVYKAHKWFKLEATWTTRPCGYSTRPMGWRKSRCWARGWWRTGKCFRRR